MKKTKKILKVLFFVVLAIGLLYIMFYPFIAFDPGIGALTGSSSIWHGVLGMPGVSGIPNPAVLP
jgi:hypothetical protein